MTVVRLRRRYDPVTREMVDVPLDAPSGPRGVLVCPDLPGYLSPVTGLWVEGRKARREDLARTECRPYEGFEQEKKEADRRLKYHEQASDRKLTDSAHRAFHQLDPAKRRILERGE